MQTVTESLQSGRAPRIAQGLLLAYWLLLFTATHIPLSGVRGGYLPGDKFLHAGAYAVLSFLFMAAVLCTRRRTSWLVALIVFAVVVAYGAIDERTQSFVGRHASLTDWYADALGAATGVLIFQWTVARWAQLRARM